jgi:hypothetical protein
MEQEDSVQSALFTAINSQHAFIFLALTYGVLPPVAMTQFQAIDCVELSHDGSVFLRSDTSINCKSQEYEAFRIAVGFFIFIYQ